MLCCVNNLGDVGNRAPPAPVNVSCALWAGLLPKWGRIPRWWKWYGYINPLRYGYGAVAINAFEGRPGALLGGLPVRCVVALPNYWL